MSQQTIRHRGLAVAVCLAALIAVPAVADVTDDQFIESLDRARDVERPRLARLLFGLAAALDAGRSSVRLMQGSVVVPDTSREAVVSLLRRRFLEYEQSLDSLREGSAALLDRPGSDVLLFDTLTDGQRACWALDRYDRVVETYSAPGGIPVLSSREACVKLRTLAFRPGVIELMREAVAVDASRARRVAELEEELEALEALLDDLHRIDAEE